MCIRDSHNPPNSGVDYRILTRVGDLFYIRKLTHSDQGSLSDPKDFHSLKTVDDSLKAVGDYPLELCNTRNINCKFGVIKSAVKM